MHLKSPVLNKIVFSCGLWPASAGTQRMGVTRQKSGVRSLKSEAGFGVGDVAGDLFFEGVEGGELFFVAQFIHQLDFDFLTVEVSLEIKEMRFDAKLWSGRSEGRAAPDFDDAPLLS